MILAGQTTPHMKHLRTHLAIAAVLLIGGLYAQAPNRIYSYAVGDWRNGPVVTISPLYETTEAFTTLELINWVRHTYPEFANITDIDVQRFATTEEGTLSRTTLKGKYEARKLQVNLMSDTTMRTAVPDRLPRPVQVPAKPAPKAK